MRYLFIAILCFGYSHEAFGAHLYSVIVADTKDDDIGVDCDSDYKKVVGWTKKIAKFTGLKLVNVHLQGNAAAPGNILKKIDSFQVSEDDVIFFYYTGHGYRTRAMGKNPPWPVYEFPESNQGLESEYVMLKLQEKKPRFLLAINDCCNVFLKKNEEEPEIVPVKLKIQNEDENTAINHYAQLFLKARGFIKVASAAPGEYSYTTEEKGKFGGKYTMAFLKSFEKAVASKKKTTWYAILDKAERIIDDDEQHPLYEILLESKPLSPNLHEELS